MGQDYCCKSFNQPTRITYSDSTISTRRDVYGVTATPIQTRFEASDSTVVPARQSPFKLPKPKKELDKREKAGIGIGVMAGVALLSIGGSIGWSYWKKRKAAGTLNHDNTDLTPDEQPPAYTRRTKQ